MLPIHSQYNTAETIVFPDAITLKILLSGKHTNGNLAVFEDIVEPGIGPGRHIHHHQDETFFFQDGNFIAEVDGQMHEFKPGDIAFIPRGTVHAFKKKGYLKEIPINSDQTYFDTNTSHHHHFYDENQKDLIDIDDADVEPVKIKTKIPGKKITSVEVLVKVEDTK